MTDEELLRTNERIPTSVILQDIADTEAEIARMTQEAEHLERTPLSLPNARWDHYRASARRLGISERQEFVAKLKKLLELRGEAKFA